MGRIELDNYIPPNSMHLEQENPGDAIYNRFFYRHRDLRLVEAVHQSKKAGDFFEQNIKPEIEDPSSWLFLIEGMNFSFYEADIAVSLAEEKNIPCVDPIISLDQIEVIDGLQQIDSNFPLDREESIGALVLEVLRLHNTVDIKLAHQILQGFGTVEELNENLFKFMSVKKNKNYQLEELSRENLEKLILVSNLISYQVWDYYLRKYEAKKNLAVYWGKRHSPVQFLNPEDIREEIYLSDPEIMELIKRRELRYQNRFEQSET